MRFFYAECLTNINYVRNEMKLIKEARFSRLFFAVSFKLFCFHVFAFNSKTKTVSKNEIKT